MDKNMSGLKFEKFVNKMIKKVPTYIRWQICKKMKWQNSSACVKIVWRKLPLQNCRIKNAEKNVGNLQKQHR